jgi:hypothetical protein
MEFDIIPDEDALGNCTWCGRRIDESAEVFAVGARLRPEVDLSAYQSHCIQIYLISIEKTITAMVTADGSQAKAEQKDLMVLTCSKKCAAALKDTLKKEAAIGDMFDAASVRC